MKQIACLILASLVGGCASRSVPDYSAVPANVPAEAKPVWLMFDAARAEDIAQLKSACTPARISEIEAAVKADASVCEKMFQEMTDMLPQNGIGALKLVVCRDSRELNRVMGLSNMGKNYVARDGFAWVLIGDKTGMPVTRNDGTWLIEGNFVDHKKNWIEQPVPEVQSEGAPSD